MASLGLLLKTSENYINVVAVEEEESLTNFASSLLENFGAASKAQMGIPSEMRDVWVQKRKAWVIASPAEDQKILRAKQCTQEGVREGFKAAAIACVSVAVPTLVAVRAIPWAKANLNYTAQALIISAATIAAYFITVDKSILKCARRNAQLEESLRSHH